MSNTILAGIKTRLLVVCSITLATLGFLGSSAHAEIRVLAAGSDTPQATEEIFANGTLVGSVDRPGWSVYRELTTEDIVNNYDVLLIPYNTADWQYDFDWNTRLLPFLASGGGVIWEAPMTTGTAGSPLFEQLGTRYTCPDLTICWIPNTPLDVLPVSGITDGITSDFTFTTGYFPSWDSRLTPFLQANATGLGTITYGLYGEISAGRIVITQNAQDDSGSSTGTAAQVNAYNLLANKLQWVSASTQTPDPDLRFVPDLDGMSEADAIAALEGQGFVVSNVFYSVSNDDLPGNVVSQDPQPGAGALVGDAVNLFVVAPATGPEVTVPDVTNMATADAEATLNAAGLERGTLIWSSHPTVPAGNIISHNPVAGETSYEGWVVDVAESTGPNPGSVPFVKYQSQAEAETVLGAAGYVTGTITLQNHNVIPAGYVISQSPGDDASLAAGGAVDLVISAGPDGVALITVPDVAGLAQADAETTLTNAGLTVNVTTTFSDTVAAGTVISQSPAAGTDVSAGTTVDLVVSAGPAPTTISVPDVTGLSQAAAETALTNAGLVVGSVTSVSSDTIAAGDVISQTPVATTDVAPGTTVDLVVSSGPALVPVPGVTGLTQTDAETAIVNAGLIVGTVTAANSDTVPAGNVISQSPGAATNVAPGSAVDLLVSTGPALITVPGVVGLAQSVAETAITNAGLTVGSVTTTASNTIPAGDVISQSPASGVEVTAGSSVDLVVSTGPDLITVPDVEGRSYSTATDIINAAGLSVGTVSTTFTRRSCGVVVNQSPNGGTSVQAGTQVDLVVTRTWRCNPL